MPLRFWAADRNGAQVLLSSEELPFAGDSLDLVLLPHILEFSATPHQICAK